MILPAAHNAPGFKVTKTDDATIFHRVPIFAQCERGDLTFDADWIAAAVQEAKACERDSYLPPLHIRHHEPATEQTDAVRSVGVFRITDASPLTFKGKRILAVFADLIVTDEYAAEELGRMKYPYRSVEIFEPEGPPKINSLALLDHEAPYLELPMLFAGEVDDKRDPRTRADDGGMPRVAGANTFSLNYTRTPANPMVGSARLGNRAALLFKFPDEETMPENETDKTTEEDVTQTNFSEVEGKEDESEDMEAGAGLDIGAVCSAIESGDISVADMDAILAAIQSQKSAAAEEDVEDAAPANTPGEAIMKSGKQALNFAKLQGENDALKARLDARDAADERKEAVGVAMKRLEGKPLGADLEGKLVSFYDKCGGNAEVFKEYVDTLALAAGDIPVDGSAENFRGQPSVPESAMPYQALGHEAVEHAVRFSREYQTNFKGRRGVRASEESYVRTNMAHAGFRLEAASA